MKLHNENVDRLLRVLTTNEKLKQATYMQDVYASKTSFVVYKKELYGSDAERSKASSTREQFFHSHMGLSNNPISGKLLVFSTWSMEQKMFIFQHKIDIRDEPARLGPTRPGSNAP